MATWRFDVGHFFNNGSCVYTAALDESKAFDKENHYKLFSILVKRGILLGLIDVLCN